MEYIFIATHLTINRVINLPTVLDIPNFIVGAEWTENRVEQSGAVSGHCKKRWSGARSGRSRSGERGLQK